MCSDHILAPWVYLFQTAKQKKKEIKYGLKWHHKPRRSLQTEPDVPEPFWLHMPVASRVFAFIIYSLFIGKQSEI